MPLANPAPYAVASHHLTMQILGEPLPSTFLIHPPPIAIFAVPSSKPSRLPPSPILDSDSICTKSSTRSPLQTSSGGCIFSSLPITTPNWCTAQLGPFGTCSSTSEKAIRMVIPLKSSSTPKPQLPSSSPRGIAHGFLALEPDSLMVYKTSVEYAPEADSGIHWDSFGHNWRLNQSPILSQRDTLECSPKTEP
jgi:hypothetical protein